MSYKIKIINYITNDNDFYPFAPEELDRVHEKNVEITFFRGGVAYKQCRKAIAVRDEKTIVIYPDDCTYF